MTDSQAGQTPEQGGPQCTCPKKVWASDGSDMNESTCEVDHDAPASSPEKAGAEPWEAALIKLGNYLAYQSGIDASWTAKVIEEVRQAAAHSTQALREELAHQKANYQELKREAEERLLKLEQALGERKP